MKKVAIIFILLTVIFGIGTVYFYVKTTNLSTENETLKQEKTSLEARVDELENGEERLIGLIDSSYANKEYENAKSYIQDLKNRHPESKKIAEYDKLLNKIIAIQKDEELKRQKEEAEKERLANLNNTGIWRIRNYVDNFGEPTSDKYISCESKIKGKFSNSATTDSDLTVQFLIDGKNEIAIMLYEYAGNHAVSGNYGTVRAYLDYRDADGNEASMIQGQNSSDRFVFGSNASLAIHNALMKGNKIKFVIDTYENGSRDGNYNFELDAKYYENAYRILTTGK